MRLFEEYLTRHQINDVPLVHHCSIGSLVLRTTDSSIWKNRWVLVNIKWQDHDHHPGHYVIDMNSPVHDGYCKGAIFTKWPPVQKRWNEYEDFFLQWSRNLKGVQPVMGNREVVLAAWEMFVFAYDSWFIKQSHDIKRTLFGSLDKDNSLNARYGYYQDVSVFLSTHHPAILRTWKYEILANVQNYADWLAVLVADKTKYREPEEKRRTIQEDSLAEKSA